MEWFRLYHDIVDDPKVQRLSPATFKHWINLLCLSSRNGERGTLPGIADIAFGLRLTEAKVRAIVAELVAAGLVDRDDETLRIHGWNNRQKRSDDVKTRVDRHRTGNDSVTLHETLQVPTTETLPRVRVKETDTEQIQNREENPPSPPKGTPRETRISEDFAIDADMTKWAESKGFSQPEIDHHTEAFTTYWRGEGGPKARKLNWRQAWQTWLLREKPGRWPGGGNVQPIRPGGKPPLPPVMERGKVPADGGLSEWINGG